MDEKFRQAEEEYFILRGKFDTGRIGKNLFELALKDLAVQDTQGRWWMIGADSGKWYMHDGKDWVEGDPLHTEVAKTVTTPLPRTTPGSPANGENSSNRLVLTAAIGCVAILCVALAGLVAYGLLNLRPGSTMNSATLAALNSPVLFSTPTFASVTTPTVGTPLPTDTLFPTPTDAPIRTRTAFPTSTPVFAPGVYVTGLRTNPSPPKRREEVIFYPSLFNSTGSPASYRLVVYVYRPDQTHAMGESFTNNLTLPLGPSEQAAPGWRLTGPGGCEDFIVRVGWVDDQKRFTPFTRPNGTSYEQPLTICP